MMSLFGRLPQRKSTTTKPGSPFFLAGFEALKGLSSFHRMISTSSWCTPGAKTLTSGGRPRPLHIIRTCHMNVHGCVRFSIRRPPGPLGGALFPFFQGVVATSGRSPVTRVHELLSRSVLVLCASAQPLNEPITGEYEEVNAAQCRVDTRHQKQR